MCVADVADAAAAGSGSLLGKTLAFHAPRRRSLGLRKLAAAAAPAVREHVATFTAMAAIDMGAFQASTAAGWIVTGLSVLVLDWKIQG